jgi:hypothetical protein
VGASNTPVEAEGIKFSTTHYRIGYEYLKTFGIELKAGRDLSRDFATDKTSAVIVNEMFVKKLAGATAWQATDVRVRRSQNPPSLA